MRKRTERKRDITERFSTRRDAERYRDRFTHGRRLHTHVRESGALRRLLQRCGELGTILDVGSGTGRFAGLFGERAARVIQLDLAAPMLDVSRASLMAASDRFAFVRADVRRLPILDRSVDLVFCHRLLNHLTGEQDRRRALAELARICHGLLVVSTLGPPRAVQQLRDSYDRWRGAAVPGISRSITPFVLIGELAAIGMQLKDRIAIRRFPVSAEFLVFARR